MKLLTGTTFEHLHERYGFAKIGTALLLLAGVVVAIAIATEGTFSRTVNGISGVLWFIGAAYLLSALRSDEKFWVRLAQVTVMCLILVIFIRPSELALALAGFSAAGAIIAGTIRSRGVTWATLLAALWLPLHLAMAVVKAAYRALRDQDAALRSDPPPTAAIVPLAMIVGAIIGAWLVQTYLLPRINHR